MDADLFRFLVDSLRSSKPKPSMCSAELNLTSEQLIALAADLKTIGPLEIDRLLEAFAQSKDPKVGEALLVSLKDSAVR